MFLRTALLAAATAIGLSGLAAEPVSAASYSATSFYNKKGKQISSAGFSKRLKGYSNHMEGATGFRKNHFSFENSKDSAGNFTINGNTATLTGILRNADGQGFEVTINYQRTKNPGVYKKRRRTSTDDWSFFKMTSGTMTSIDGELASFDLSMIGSKWDGSKRRKLAAQLGTGANSKNRDLMGLFTRFQATEQDCDSSVEKCRKYNGSFRLVLSENDPLAAEAAGLIDDGNVAVVPLPASALLLPAALGMFGLAGGIARRRRQG